MKLVAVSLLLAISLAGGADGHRLDEYLQATLIGVTRDGVDLEINLTPGIAVLPAVMAEIDRNRDGRISPEEEQAYSTEVIRDLELRVDGKVVPLRLIGSRFPSVEDMREGLGTIRLNLHTDSSGHELRFENRHMQKVSVYLVNCLASGDSGLLAGSPIRAEDQRSIRFTYSFANSSSWPAQGTFWIAGIGMVTIARLALRRQTGRG